MSTVYSRFGFPEDYKPSAEVVPDDLLPKETAEFLMNKLISTIAANSDDFDTSTLEKKSSVAEAILLCIAANGSVTRAHFRHKLTCIAGKFDASWISSILGTDIRRFARYYADLTRALLKENLKAQQVCLRKYGYYEDPSLNFDTAQYCTGLSQETAAELARIAKRKLDNSKNYTPSTMQMDAEEGETPPRVSLRRTHGGDDDLY